MSRTLTQRELLVAESETEGPRALRDELEAFLDCASRMVDTHPWLVVVAMHEYFRCIYPADPHLPFDEKETPLARVRRVLGSCPRLLEARQQVVPSSKVVSSHVTLQRLASTGRCLMTDAHQNQVEVADRVRGNAE